jgi:hypothetical protein
MVGWHTEYFLFSFCPPEQWHLTESNDWALTFVTIQVLVEHLHVGHFHNYLLFNLHSFLESVLKFYT